MASSPSYKYVTTILVLFFNLQACSYINRTRTNKDILLDEQVLKAKYISIYGVVNYQPSNKRAYKCNFKLYIERDNSIWFSIMHAWGGEIMRGKITSTGVEIINHIEKSYKKYNYATLQAYWKIPSNYMLLQAMLLAELPTTGTGSEKIASGKHIIIQQNTWRLLTKLAHNSANLTSLTITDNITLDKGSIFYDYKKNCAQNFLFCAAKAYFRDFNLAVEYKKVMLPSQPLKLPFKIPAQYESL